MLNKLDFYYVIMLVQIKSKQKKNKLFNLIMNKWTVGFLFCTVLAFFIVNTQNYEGSFLRQEDNKREEIKKHLSMVEMYEIMLLIGQ
jgi:hypothetical protein